MKKLYLVRHAKSSWKDMSLSDQQRPLNGRGKKNAPEMGKRLAEAGIRIDRLISSPATRARDTARHIAAAIDFPDNSIEINDDLYFHGVNSMLEIISGTDERVQTLMLVGHNPDMTEMLNDLCGYQVDNMPTCAIACISFDATWSEVDFDKGELKNYNIPKNHPDF